MRPTIGCWLEPEDAVDPNFNMDAVTHKLSGCCWAEEQLVDHDTGELVDYFHLVRVHQGFLAFHDIHAGRIGTVSPPQPGTIDGIIRVAGKHLTGKGRHCERRVVEAVRALRQVAQNMPDADVPSLFEPLPDADLHAEEDAGWQLLPMPADPDGAGLTVAQGVMMRRRLAALDAADHTAGNEVRRAARVRGLPALVDGVELNLTETVAYDEILRRWERHTTRSAT